MLAFLLLLLHPTTTSSSLKSTWQTDPLQMNLCHHTTWLNRHHVVYLCNFTNLASSEKATRELTPIACDPSNGVETRAGRRILFLGQEYKAEDGFVYECAKDLKTGAITYRAKSCYVDDERFLPGHYIKGRQNTIWLCYRDLDNVVRLRVRHPVHSACNPVEEDPRCMQGIAQTIISSVYGYGEPFKYNPSTGESLTVAIPPPENAQMINLADDALNVSPNDLLLAVQGVLDPRVHRPIRVRTSTSTLRPGVRYWQGNNNTATSLRTSEASSPREEFKKAK